MEQVTIDRFGRIVIPKKARKQLGLSEGTKLQLEVVEGTVVLRPDVPTGRLVRERGILVWDPGVEVTDFDWSSAVEQAREERIRQILGED